MESYRERPTCKRFCKMSQTKWKKIDTIKQNAKTAKDTRPNFKDLQIYIYKRGGKIVEITYNTNIIFFEKRRIVET